VSASLGVHVLANALDKAILQLEDQAVVIVVVPAVSQRGLHAFLDDDGIAVGVEPAEVDRHVGDEYAAEVAGQELHDAVASDQVADTAEYQGGGVAGRGEPLGVRREDRPYPAGVTGGMPARLSRPAACWRARSSAVLRSPVSEDHSGPSGGRDLAGMRHERRLPASERGRASHTRPAA